jgi:hypothetical protein
MKRNVRDRKLTPEEAAKYKRLRELVEQDKPAIARMAREYENRRDRIAAIVRAMKAQRDAQGLSLADIRERSGLDRAALSRLENGLPENPSIETLLRYADAVGCEIVVQPAK